jgi:hypothetical protein
MIKNKMDFGKARSEILQELRQQYRKIDTFKQYKFFDLVIIRRVIKVM